MISDWLGLGVGLLLGVTLGWLVAAARARQHLRTEREARIKAETHLQALQEARKQLEDSFKALSDDALKSNNKAFLDLARQSLETVLAEAKGELGLREQAIEGLVTPLAEALSRYEAQISSLEQSRQKAYGSLEEHLKSLLSTQQLLQRETGNLVSALRRPEIRGRWGELTLVRVMELAGMSQHCDFTEQVTTVSDDGRLRPDVVVSLPNKQEIVIDAKVPLDAYLDALYAESEELRAESLARHVQQLRAHMYSLAEKGYWEQFDRSPEFVVMFIPAESFLAAAADLDHALIEDGMEKKVVIATPTTLITLMRSVAYGWRQEQLAENAQRISEHGRQLHKRMRTMAEHIIKLGKELKQAGQAYDSMIGSIESKVLPAARRFKELGAATDDDIPVIQPIELTPRKLTSPELVGTTANDTSDA